MPSRITGTHASAISDSAGRIEAIDEFFKNLINARNSNRIGSARLKQSNVGRNILFGYDDADRKRRLLYRVRDGEILPKKKAVRTQELRLTTRNLDGDASNEVIELVQEKISDFLFAEFVSNVLDALAKIEPAKRNAESFIRCIKARIYEAEPPQSFTHEKQTGLMGELHVLEHDLIPGLGGAEAALHAWKGPFGKSKDFDLPECCCIEVKATKAAKKREFHVNGESQLVKPEKKPLILVFYVFEALDSGGKTVAERYKEVRKHFSDSRNLLSRFDEAVRRAGYNPQLHDKYDLKSFTYIKRQFFKVGIGFPILRRAHLYAMRVKKQDGTREPWIQEGTISDFEYSVCVNALGKFEIGSESEYKRMLRSLGTAPVRN